MVGKNKLEDNVLYELLVYSEWKQEPEVWKNHLSESTFGKALGLFSVFHKIIWPPEEIKRLTQLLLPWQISVSEDGKIVAVLQETTLEIRTSRDDFTSVLAKAIVFKDNAPQWRKMEWSSDCSMLAISSSSGSVYVYHLLGSLLFTIPGPNEQPKFSDIYIASLIFIKARTESPKWPLELLIIRYNGVLNSYYVSTTDGYLEAHTTVLSKTGLSAAAVYPNHNLLFVAVKPQHTSYETQGHSVGLSTWRLLNDSPYFKMVSPTQEQLNDYSTSKYIQSWFHFANPVSYIYKMKLSPKGRFLSCLHADGTISIWQAPSLRLNQKWSLEEQENILPAADNSETDERIKHMHQPIDTEWRADEKLIIARFDGNILICEVDPIRLCEGSEPEQLCGHPRISSAPSHTGFLAIECEEVVLNGEANLLKKATGEDANSFLNTSSELLQSTIYMITDLEKYEPKRRHYKIVQRNYKLLGVKSTTPEELFNRKLDYEDYDEALALARKYNLDSDRVYQRQWRNSPVSSETIQNFLSKIKKKTWVLDEFLIRVPETLDGAKELMNFAFSYTDIKSINAVSGDGEEDIENWKIVDLNTLQKQMISTRIKLIDFSDKLHTYELIITSGNPADFYDTFQYEKFRNLHIVESAIQFARSGHVKAVKIIIAQHPQETKPYLLNILENFPETLPASKYSELLPECDGDYKLLSLDQVVLKPQDWCKSSKFRTLDEVVKGTNYLEKYGPMYEMDVETVEEWYKNRVSFIEEKTCILDNALQLLVLAKKRNIKGLEALHADLSTLETLVYELAIDGITLSSFNNMSSLDVAFLLISKATDDNFSSTLISFVLPYFDRCMTYCGEDKYTLMLELLTSVSTKNLLGPTQFFRYVINGNMKLIGYIGDVVTLFVECVYSYKYFEQLELAKNLVDELIDTLKSLSELSSKECWLTTLNELRDELIATDILHKNYIVKSVTYLHKIKSDAESMRKLLNQMARTFYKYYSAEAEEYNYLLNDIILLQSGIFHIIPLNECYEVFIKTLLDSGSSTMIEFSSNVLCCSSEEEGLKNITIDRSVSLIIETARSYFDLAENFNCRSMELAKACLLLMKEEHRDIQEELDLISSLRMLSEFNLNLVPVEVRHTKDRLILIKKCLSNNPHSYRDPSKIYKLAAKLRVYEDNINARHCAVTNCLAEAALKDNAFESCADFCNILINREEPTGWEICLKLARSRQYLNTKMKLKLLSFSTLHCPSRLLPCISQIRSNLELILCEIKLNRAMTKRDTEEEIYYQDYHSEESLIRRMKTFNPANILSRIVSTEFLNTGGYRKSEAGIGRYIKRNETFDRFSCPSFYESLFKNPHLSRLNYSYEKPGFISESSPKLDIYRLLLRTSLIYQEIHGPVHSISLEDVSVICSQLTILEDTTLGLSHLLSLSTPEVAEECFISHPKSRFMFNLAIYYYALHANMSNIPGCLYIHPQKVLQKALELGNSVCSSMIEQHMSNMKKYIQVEKIKKLDCGVNTERFALDQDYKRDSIFGLAMSEDLNKLDLALEMSLQNNIPLHEVAISHITSLFLNQMLNIILDRINVERIKVLLKEHPTFTIQRLTSEVLPSISGLNHQGLITFFSVIKMVNEEEYISNMLPKEHIKLLKKIKSVSAEIEYKKLVIDKAQAIDIFMESATPDNLGSLCKLWKCLPSSIKGNISPSVLYLNWAINQFNYKCLNVSLTIKQCVQCFESLYPFLTKLATDELRIFLLETILDSRVIYVLDYSCRKHIISSIIEWIIRNNLERNEEFDIHQVLVTRMDIINKIWDDEMDPCIMLKLKSYLMHLEDHICSGDNETRILIEAIFDVKLSPKEVNLLVSLTNLQNNWPFIILEYCEPEIDDERFNDLLDRIELFLQVESESLSWLSLLKKLMQSQCISKNSKLVTANLIKKFERKQSDNLFIITKSLLPDEWSLQEIDLSDVKNREETFATLLEKSKIVDHIACLHNIILHWPPLNKRGNAELNMIQALLYIEGEGKYPLIPKIMQEHDFSEDVLIDFLERNEEKGDILALCFVCLLSDSASLHNKAIDFLQTVDKVLIPREICETIISKGLLPQIAGMNIYHAITQNILRLDENKDLVQLAAKSLINEDILPEAGSLDMEKNRIPPSLRLYDSAIFISKKLKIHN